jgi:Fe-S cluster biogenesis protein NfuA
VNGVSRRNDSASRATRAEETVPLLEQRARKLIDEVVRPLVAADGGEIELVRVIDQRIIVRLSGMCAGCPGRPYTLSGVIEPVARRWLGDGIAVEAEKD